MKKLNNKELRELKGGAVCESNPIDVKNTNGVAGCKCTYLDNGVVENNNTIQGCLCTCKKANLITT